MSLVFNVNNAIQDVTLPVMTSARVMTGFVRVVINVSFVILPVIFAILVMVTVTVVAILFRVVVQVVKAGVLPAILAFRLPVIHAIYTVSLIIAVVVILLVIVVTIRDRIVQQPVGLFAKIVTGAIHALMVLVIQDIVQAGKAHVLPV